MPRTQQPSPAHLPWKGRSAWWRLRYARWFHKRRLSYFTRTLQSVARARQNELQSWFDGQWTMLETCARALASSGIDDGSLLKDFVGQLPEATELVTLSPAGEPVASSAGTLPQLPDGFMGAESMKHQRRVIGPLTDPRTVELGGKSSDHHDAVTLFLGCPIAQGASGDPHGILLARIPNDALGDVLQSAESHVFDTGDNYLVASGRSGRLAPGTMLTRSRFEEDFKKGVATKHGVLRVSEHTEFEVIARDPATGAPQYGVQRTLEDGQHAFVDYPGYADYRGVPVVGAGILVEVEGAEEPFALLCEADLADVFSPRSIGYKQGFGGLVYGVAGGGGVAASMTLAPAAWQLPLAVAAAMLAATVAGAQMGTRVQMRLARMIAVLRGVVLGRSDYATRLHDGKHRIPNDETGALASWIDRLLARVEAESTEGVVERAASTLAQSTQAMGQAMERVSESGRAIREDSEQAASGVEEMAQSVRHIAQESTAARDLAQEAHETAQSGTGQAAAAREKIAQVREAVEENERAMERMSEDGKAIGELIEQLNSINQQTHMLALNASIEAARAGSAGRGFAVVAGQFQTLAHEAEAAARQAQQVITRVQDGIEQASATSRGTTEQMREGTEAVEHAEGAFSSIETQAREVLREIDTVAQATEEQSSVARELGEQMERIASQGKTSYEEIARAAQIADRLLLLGRRLGAAGKETETGDA